ncbi:unnamed protein product, partial [Mesorhabditis belari]|uniref:Secreted protein n=1 Tax=Mesorhabditis belari TaxID=2138241 RepID=A0AAF3FK14_9BILA
MKESILLIILLIIEGNAKPSQFEISPIEGKLLSNIDQETMCKIIDENSKKETNSSFQKIYQHGKEILCVEKEKDFINQVFKCSFNGNQETIENIHKICNEITEKSNDLCNPAHRGLSFLALFTQIDYIADRAKCFTEVVEAMEKLGEERKEGMHKIYFAFNHVD